MQASFSLIWNNRGHLPWTQKMKWDPNMPPQNHGGSYELNQAGIRTMVVAAHLLFPSWKTFLIQTFGLNRGLSFTLFCIFEFASFQFSSFLVVSVLHFFYFSVLQFSVFLVWRPWSHAHLFQWSWSENAKRKNKKLSPGACTLSHGTTEPFSFKEMVPNSHLPISVRHTVVPI